MDNSSVENVDYVIVGAGSAGCVLADKLSADGRSSVVLIESGGPGTSSLISMPRGIGALLVPTNPHVWSYQVAPQPGRSEELWLKGRTIGGSSSVNGMVYVRGAPADYDGWEEQAAPVGDGTKSALVSRLSKTTNCRRSHFADAAVLSESPSIRRVTHCVMR